jgi:hypothetical protein
VEKGIKTYFTLDMTGKPGYFPCARGRRVDDKLRNVIDDGSMTLEAEAHKQAR